MSAAGGVKSLDQATAFAPASVANVAVGFDVLGHTIEGPKAFAELLRRDERGQRRRRQLQHHHLRHACACRRYG